MSIKNSNDTIGNRTRDLPTCDAVPQPTAPPRAPVSRALEFNLIRSYKSNQEGKCFFEKIRLCRVIKANENIKVLLYFVPSAFNPHLC